MNLNKSTIIEFEDERRKNNYIPPIGSNSFYNIGDGEINIFTAEDSSGPCFDLFTNTGLVSTGDGEFVLGGIDSAYRNLTVIPNTSFCVTDKMAISSSIVEVHGTLITGKKSKLYIIDNSYVTLYTDSVFDMGSDTEIIVGQGSILAIYGRVNVHVDTIDNLLNTPNIRIDSAAFINVEGIDTSNRAFSMTDYELELRDKIINVHTQGERNSGNNKLGYTWMGGTPIDHSQLIDISVLYGSIVLGDFKLSALGMPEKTTPNSQMIANIHVQKGCTLYISELYDNGRYVRPELYLGIVIGNNVAPAKCIVDGNIIVDGANSILTVDRKAEVHISETGSVYVKNNAIFRSTHNDSDKVLFINGKLIIDTIEQIETFNHDNIVFGDNGKVIILNPDTGTRKLLWSTPDGIESSTLYRLFKDRIEHVEYHISNNTGICIDKYYKFYNRQMINWYGGRRIEQAVHEGLIVWHDGGFIELHKKIIPWVSLDSTLYDIAKLFKVTSSYPGDQLQECANKLMYAGFGDIVFRFVINEDVSEIRFTLKGIKLMSVVKTPNSNSYSIESDNDGILFARNNVSNLSVSNIVIPEAKQLFINDGHVEFQEDK